MECPNGCSTAMQFEQIERIFYRSDEPVVIRDLEILVCPECGCESMPLKSARIIESVLNNLLKPIGQFSAPLFHPAQQT